MNKNSTTRAFATLVSVFFFWGFVAASNDILIPVFKDKLHLEQWQSQMISFAFYVAYTLGALGYMLVSFVLKRDLLGSVGYGKGISLGLIISAIGSLLFIPAADAASFPMLLGGLILISVSRVIVVLLLSHWSIVIVLLLVLKKGAWLEVGIPISVL